MRQTILVAGAYSGFVVNTVLKIIKEERPKYSYPVGKGASFAITMDLN